MATSSQRATLPSLAPAPNLHTSPWTRPTNPRPNETAVRRDGDRHRLAGLQPPGELPEGAADLLALDRRHHERVLRCGSEEPDDAPSLVTKRPSRPIASTAHSSPACRAASVDELALRRPTPALFVQRTSPSAAVGWRVPRRGRRSRVMAIVVLAGLTRRGANGERGPRNFTRGCAARGRPRCVTESHAVGKHDRPAAARGAQADAGPRALRRGPSAVARREPPPMQARCCAISATLG